MQYRHEVGILILKHLEDDSDNLNPPVKINQ